MTSEFHDVFVLMIVFSLKHFIADFPLQRNYMLQKVAASWAFFLPLATHCAVHAAITLVICLAYKPELYWLAAVDFVIHFFMDRIKSGPRYLGRFNDIHKDSFWISLGFDQLVHHLTNIYLVYLLLR